MNFKRSVLEALRQSLENNVISVALAETTVDCPADFTLVEMAKPCPYDYDGSKKTVNAYQL